MKLLITGGMSAFAQRVARSIPEGNEIIFGDAIAIPEVLVKSGKYQVIPFYRSPTFSHELLKLALNADIEVIVPLRKEEIRSLAESKVLFEEYGIQVAVPSLEALKEVSFVANPDKVMQPVLVLRGKRFQSEKEAIALDDRSGVCLVADSGEDLFFCCLESD
ncbi:hypothetical protein GCM10023231_15390 [Olivibacter ginsenosidimutans]|uniref:Uncharacterized protein n=1 Tax=Olivibacter ginsenosidimutans TaxID=1176537 RepID=A0ABP9AZA7_9SPHI